MKRLKTYSIIFLLLTVLLSCNEDDDTVPNDDMGNQNDPGNTNFDFFINFTANGEAISYGYSESNPDFTFLPAMSYSEFFEGTSCFRTCDSGIISGGSDVIPQAGISFYRFLDALCASSDPSVFNSLFSTGQYNYAATAEENGIGFNYATNTPEEAFYLSIGGDQTGSNFSITSSTEDNISSPTGTLYTQIVTGTFNCTLYNEDDVNDTIEITAGSFRLRIESDE